MPPQPGKIHSLPVKVLYSLDTSTQSYVTLLSNKHDVYVHPSGLEVPSYESGDDEGSMGSCYLKAAVRGICYASPECIPNSTSLDFSIYNLDPALRSRQRHAFANPSGAGSSGAQSMTEDSWTGKGFLSWALNESGNGSTLIKGRLLRDHEFSPVGFDDGGGLEGLMAAAARAGSGQREDNDGKGWGLEVCVSLKMVNPEGKEEFRGRGQFEEMLRRPNGLTSVSSPSTTPRATRTAQQQQPHQPQSHVHQHPHQPPQQPVQPMPRVNGSSTVSLPQSHASSSNYPSSSSLRPSPAISSSSLPQQQNHRPQPQPQSSSSRFSQPSSLPPSSIPMSASSSAGAGPSRPSSTAPGAQGRGQAQAPSNIITRTNGHASSSLPPPSSSHAAPSSSREVTPPPPTRKSPPPSTPSRERLHALLRTDEKMSPGLAKHLAANPTLLSLLKAVPASTLITLSNQHKSPGDGEATTPTPSATIAKPPMTVSAEGCCNCGTKESELWRTKNMKDGTKKKVCNACGLYFNKHKRMRPAELWGTSAHDDLPPPEKRVKIDDHSTPVRSSPRLRHQSSDHSNTLPQIPGITESPRKRKMSKAVPQPSPRMSTRLSSKLEGTMEGKQLDFGQFTGTGQSGTDLFSPTTMFGTSPAQPLSGNNPTIDTANLHPIDLGQEGDIDIEALLTQIANGDGQNGFSLDALFANVGNGTNASGSGSAVAVGENSIMDLLSAWENETKIAQQQHDNTQGGTSTS